MQARLLLVAAFLAAGVLPAEGQQTPTADQPTFRSGVDLVRFDVRVTDEAGRPITDLRPEEIDIYENGRKLPIVMFQRVTEPAGEYVDAAMRAVTAEVSSNEAFPRGHLYILIFDQQHITPGREQRARQAAAEFIRTRVRPSDRVALFALPGPGPQMDFTADTMRVLGQLKSIRGMYESTMSTPFGTIGIYEAHRVALGDEKLTVDLLERMRGETGVDVVGGATRSPVTGAGAIAAEDAAVTRRLFIENARVIVNQTDAASRQFLQRLAEVIARFRDIEGRKTVVLFSEGFFQDNLSRELEAVAAAAAQSYCVFYTFDLNQRAQQLEQAGLSDTVHASEVQARIAPLSTLAVETDGMMVLDAASRSRKALGRIADQAQDYYLVGFTPSEEARSSRGRYRRVSVRVARPGAHASARTGYALPPEATPVDRKRAINSVLGAPFAQQGLKLDYTTYVMKGTSGQHRVILSLNADLPVRSKPDDAADIVFAVRDLNDARMVANGAATIPLPESPRAGAALGAGSWRAQFDLPAGSYLMRMVVREPGGLVGSADRRLEIGALTGPDVTVSDLVVGSALSGLPVRPRVYTGSGMTGIMEAYGRTAVQLEGLAAHLELRPVEGSGTVSTMAAEVRDVEAADDGSLTRKLTFVLPLTGVAPGSYLAHAVVSARGEIIAERTRQLEVMAGAAPPLPASMPAGVPPIEIARGDLGRRYVDVLSRQLEGTPLAQAGRLASAGRWEEADLAIRRAPAPAGMSAEALRGFVAFVREDYATAAAALGRALDSDANGLTAFFLGWAHDGLGNTRDAISAWRQAAHIDPLLVSVHLALADGYLKLSERALAIQALRAGLAALPGSPELQARLRQLEQMR